jgi:MFS family permease
MHRSIAAVLIGTLTLRFSTGLTGALLLVYLARLPEFGEPEVSASIAGAMAAAYFGAELVLSPLFGVLCDRIGNRPVMQIGPLFGAVAVVVTALTTNLWILGGTRWLEGMAAAASIPPILGFIALATAGDDRLRGRTVARFEAATIVGLGLGAVAAGPLWDLLGPTAFYGNAAVYIVSLLIYRYGVREEPATEAVREAAAGPPVHSAEIRPGGFDLARYRRLLAGTPVLLLAPTWIALNAIVGAWTTQSIFQLTREPSDRFGDQLLMGGFEATQVSVGIGVALVIFFAGIFFWGGLFRRFRRTTIIGLGIAGGLLMVAAVAGLNHSRDWGMLAQAAIALAAAGGLFVLAGATPAALGLLADISEHAPLDRGAIMGLYSVFLGVGQIVGSLASGVAADWLGIDGLLIASLALLLVALLPLSALRASEHLVRAPSPSGA